jgi:hypothetical protein
MRKPRPKYSHLNDINNDKKLCHALYRCQFILQILLILFLGGVAIVAQYLSIHFIARATLISFTDYLKLATLLSSCPPGILMLKVFKMLSSTTHDYLSELSKFNSEIGKIQSVRFRQE